jgi:dienelactone hydrolase
VDAGPAWTAALNALSAAVQAEGMRWRSCSAAAIGPALTELFNEGVSNGGVANGAVSNGAVAICGFGPTAAPAVWAAAEDGRVGALVLLDPELDAQTVELISAWPEVAVLAGADPSHRPELASAVAAYLASRHAGSDLLAEAFDELAWSRVARWTAAQLAATGSTAGVVVRTADGWELHGTLRLPSAKAPVPGVVLLHSGRSDRDVFSHLEILVVQAGLAVLNLDWRGRGESTNRGTLFALSDAERAEGWRDGVAALSFLAAHPAVDADRLGVLGVVQGAEIAVRAAARTPGVRAVVILTGYRPAAEEESAYLTGGGPEVLYIASADHGATTAAMRELYAASRGRRTRYIEYPGTALGYQLFEVDAHLEPTITAWFREVLVP